MGSEQYPVTHRGIYHNLPTFDPTLKNLTAIVTGANGISGFHTMRVLLNSPQRWSKVYALSRRPPPSEMMGLLPQEHRSRVQHVACDFLDSPDKIVHALQANNVTADYVFFYSYLQPKPPPGAAAWSNADELVRVNHDLLNNFLQALTQAKITPSRVLLQTGAKNYGIHIGRHRTPALESDPQPSHLAPNFYYPQEKLLFDYCKANDTSWNVIRPSWIIGAVNNAQINGLHPWAVYAAVQAHKGEPIKFPGGWNSWQWSAHHATAMLTGYLSEWAVLEDKCKNEAFNAQDTSPLSWDRLFEELARWYGVEEGVEGPEDDENKYNVTMGAAGKDTPMGYGPAPRMLTTFTLVDWARDPANQQAWKEMTTKSNGRIKNNPFDEPVENFQYGDACIQRMGILNMSKARRLGWTGYVDTRESIFEMYFEEAKLGMIPEMKVDAPRALV